MSRHYKYPRLHGRPQTRNEYTLYATQPPKGDGASNLWRLTYDMKLWYRDVTTFRRVLAVVRTLLDQGQSGKIYRCRNRFRKRYSIHYSDRYGRDEWTFGRR